MRPRRRTARADPDRRGPPRRCRCVRRPRRSGRRRSSRRRSRTRRHRPRHAVTTGAAGMTDGLSAVSLPGRVRLGARARWAVRSLRSGGLPGRPTRSCYAVVLRAFGLAPGFAPGLAFGGGWALERCRRYPDPRPVRARAGRLSPALARPGARLSSSGAPCERFLSYAFRRDSVAVALSPPILPQRRKKTRDSIGARPDLPGTCQDR